MKIFPWGLATFVALTAVHAQAGDWIFTDGSYQWKAKNFCSYLEVSGGDDFVYKYDKGCDGSTDYRGRNVYLRGNKIYIDAAYIELSEVTDEKIDGSFHMNGRSSNSFFRKIK